MLELAAQLELSESQRCETEAAFSRMHGSATALGAELVAAEERLDRLFRGAEVDEASLNRTVREIARLQGEIRLAHLRAHLEQRAILSPVQVAHYDRERGYGQNREGHEAPADCPHQ